MSLNLGFLFVYLRYMHYTLLHSKNVRFGFAHNVLFNVSNRFSEYLLECLLVQKSEAFAKLIVFIAHFSCKMGHVLHLLHLQDLLVR